jgi:hypothetical protein
MMQQGLQSISTELISLAAEKHSGKVLAYGENLPTGHVAVVVVNNNEQPAYSFPNHGTAKEFETTLTLSSRRPVKTEIYNDQQYNRIFALVDLSLE